MFNITYNYTNKDYILLNSTTFIYNFDKIERFLKF